MKTIVLATVAATLLAGAASAQGLPDGKGNAAGGYRGDQQRRLGTDGGAGADDSDGDGDE